MINVICSICNQEFSGKGRQKYCNDKCRYEGWKTYLRLRYAKKFQKEKKEFEISESYFVKLSHRKFCKSKNRRIIWTKEMSKKMKYLVENQQFFPKYIKKKYCEVCGASKKIDSKIILYKHHIKYNPVVQITMCSSCHSFLHLALLQRRKCNGC